MSTQLGLLFVGVGGQGVLTATRLLGQAALTAGHEARVGQLHGMAQRGGSLESTIVLGTGQTAYVSHGEVDVLVALDPLEAARALPRVTGRTLALVNSTPLVPYSLTSRGQSFPELGELLAPLHERADKVLLFDGTTVAREAGERRALNIVMLGALAELSVLPFGAEVLEETIATHLGAKRGEVARAIFQAGRRARAAMNENPEGSRA